MQEHEIFDTLLAEIAAAETFLIADFFLWNPWKGALGASGALRPLASELAEALIQKHLQNPDMPMLVISDPINRIYGKQEPEYFQRMVDAGIPIVFTALDQLPDSNLVYAPQVWFWSKFLPSIGSDVPLSIPNPFDPSGDNLTLGQLGRLLYFKANHRKVLITGRGGSETRLLLSSLNPADGSANHSNIGLLVDGPVARFAADSELAIARWSSSDKENSLGEGASDSKRAISEIQTILDRLPEGGAAEAGEAAVAYRSEKAIRDEMIRQFAQAGAGTRIDIALFYFSDRLVVESLIAAVDRGAKARVLLDANRDAFGRKKNGIPNRIVAAELMDLSGEQDISVRWAATNGEQFHSKVLRISGPGQEILFLGSANWTRRNLGNLNLESNLLLVNVSKANSAFDHYFDSIWENRRGMEESLPYSDWEETGWSLRWKRWLYRFQEWSGASTF